MKTTANSQHILTEIRTKNLVQNYLKVTLIKYFSLSSKISFLTFRTDAMELEREIRKFYKKATMVCLEKNKTIFDKACKLNEGLKMNMRMINKSELEYFSKPDIAYDFIWLDCASPWDKNKELAINSMLQNGFINATEKKSAIFAVTIMGSLDFYKINELVAITKDYKIAAKNPEERRFKVRLGGIPPILNYMFNEHGLTLEPLTIMTYRDLAKNNKVRRMNLYIFEVVKGIYPIDVLNTGYENMLKDFV